MLFLYASNSLFNLKWFKAKKKKKHVSIFGFFREFHPGRDRCIHYLLQRGGYLNLSSSKPIYRLLFEMMLIRIKSDKISLSLRTRVTSTLSNVSISLDFRFHALKLSKSEKLWKNYAKQFVGRSSKKHHKRLSNIFEICKKIEKFLRDIIQKRKER